ncbi:hypothetical protein PRZ48_012767 [Zasmidium cellare]|uniref:Transcription factor domain-containing protein n=1 Tax=Zasmidium cellare TaxID=395010 RepID=A0ABR0E639_ZASCE|nr:hypothetical protein PRZ48_012767 [Zasmidium cellare]
MEFVWSASTQGSKRRTLQDKSLFDSGFGSQLIGSKLPCDTCRTRKKRCFHTEADLEVLAPSNTATAPTSHVKSGEQSTRESSPGVDGIGAYAPESILEDISSVTGPLSSSTHDLPTPSSHRPFSLTAAEQSALEARIESRRTTWCSTRRTHGSPKLSEAHKRFLRDQGAYLKLPASTVSILLPLYICTLDDLIPIVECSGVIRDFSNDDYSIYLVRAICLVTCKLPQATPHLRLFQGGPVLSCGEFASKLLEGLEAALDANLEVDRITKVQILALMHLYNDGRNGRERASKNLSSAINEAWAMALHQRTPGVSASTTDDMLWWSLRNLDRLSKPVMGVAPYFIDDADIGIDRITGVHDSYRYSLMTLSTMLGDLITTATRVHKASARGSVDTYLEFPSLAEITAGMDFAQFYKPHRAYFEIWHALAAMLSCRHGRPDSGTYSRRLESAESVVNLLHDKDHEDVPPLPLVPYTLSMATTVIYRALVDGQKAPWEAHQDLTRCCDSLDTLSQRWTSVRGITRLAKRLLRHITLPARSDVEPDIVNQAEAREIDREAVGAGCDSTEIGQLPAENNTNHMVFGDSLLLSNEDFNNVLLDAEVDRHFGAQAFENFQDMGTANFLDYLAMSYTEDEIW